MAGEELILKELRKTNDKLDDIYAVLNAISASLMIDHVSDEEKAGLKEFIADIWKEMKPVETET